MLKSDIHTNVNSGHRLNAAHTWDFFLMHNSFTRMELKHEPTMGTRIQHI